MVSSTGFRTPPLILNLHLLPEYHPERVCRSRAHDRQRLHRTGRKRISMEPSPPSASVTPKSPAIIVSAEFLRFFIVIFILGSLFLGVPYGLRLYRNSWAAPKLHPDTALTGEWVGILKPSSHPAPPDLSPNPLVAESDRQEAIRELRQQKQDDFDNVRAIF